MGRWAEAFQASIQRRDTSDTVDTSSGKAAALGQSVNSVSSVTPKKEPEHGSSASSSDLVSAVSAVSCLPIREPLSLPGGERPPTDPAHLDSAGAVELKLPVSWAAPAVRPVPGGYCSCCHGMRWWSEAHNPRGWRCWTCHPPDHLSARAILEIRT